MSVSSYNSRVLEDADRILEKARLLMKNSDRESTFKFEPLNPRQISKLQKNNQEDRRITISGNLSKPQFDDLRSLKNVRQQYLSAEKDSNNDLFKKHLRITDDDNQSRFSENVYDRIGFKGRRGSVGKHSIPDNVDFGTNIFITYCLHAIEIERLILMNKEQIEEANEMEKEIDELEEENIALKKKINGSNNQDPSIIDINLKYENRIKELEDELHTVKVKLQSSQEIQTREENELNYLRNRLTELELENSTIKHGKTNTVINNGSSVIKEQEKKILLEQNKKQISISENPPHQEKKNQEERPTRIIYHGEGERATRVIRYEDNLNTDDSQPIKNKYTRLIAERSPSHAISGLFDPKPVPYTNHLQTSHQNYQSTPSSASNPPIQVPTSLAQRSSRASSRVAKLSSLECSRYMPGGSPWQLTSPLPRVIISASSSQRVSSGDHQVQISTGPSQYSRYTSPKPAFTNKFPSVYSTKLGADFKKKNERVVLASGLRVASLGGVLSGNWDNRNSNN